MNQPNDRPAQNDAGEPSPKRRRRWPLFSAAGLFVIGPVAVMAAWTSAGDAASEESVLAAPAPICEEGETRGPEGHLSLCTNGEWVRQDPTTTTAALRCEEGDTRGPDHASHCINGVWVLERARTTQRPTTTAPPPPPPPPVEVSGPPPSILIDCGAPVSGDWDWYHIDFGYGYDSGEPIVEWGMDYGDGKNWIEHDEASAQQDVYWHKYHSPGSYPVHAWVIDSLGRRDDAFCIFTWFGGSGDGAGDWSDSSYGDYDSGDLDCEDIGEEIYIDGDDPNNLDGDGDGVGCEGW